MAYIVPMHVKPKFTYLLTYLMVGSLLRNIVFAIGQEWHLFYIIYIYFVFQHLVHSIHGKYTSIGQPFTKLNPVYSLNVKIIQNIFIFIRVMDQRWLIIPTWATVACKDLPGHTFEPLKEARSELTCTVLKMGKVSNNHKLTKLTYIQEYNIFFRLPLTVG